MALTVGIDVVHVPRFDRVVSNQRLLDRAFTEAELGYCRDRRDRLAGRWAAKEAVMKALGRGLGELALTDIEVLADPSGAPRLDLHGSAARAAAEGGWEVWQVSIAHDGEYATAIAIGMPRGCECGTAPGA